MKEHQNDIENQKPASHVFQHTNNNPGHTFDFDNIKVLDNENNLRSRRQLEGVHSFMNKDSINKCLPVNNAYKQFLVRR